MENPLFPLKSTSAMWLSPSSAAWAMDMTLAFVSGLLLFFVLSPYLQSNPSFPSTQKQKIRGHQIAKRRHSKIRKTSGAHKACRECLKEVQEAWDLTSLLHSHLQVLHDKYGCHLLFHESSAGETLQHGPAMAHQPPRQHQEEPAPATSPPLASLVPVPEHPLPQASSLSEKPKEMQSALSGVPVGDAPQRSPLGNSYLASLITAIPGLDHLHCSTSFISWWWATAKALFFSTWVPGKPQQGHISHNPPEASCWGDPRHWQVEAGGASFIRPDIQKLLEMLIAKRVELRTWKEKEEGGSFFKPTSLEYGLGSLGSMLRSLGFKRDTTAQPFCSTKGGTEQLPGAQQLPYPEESGERLEPKYSQLLCWGLPSLHSESLVATAWVAKQASKKRASRVSFNDVTKSFPIENHLDESPQPSLKEPLPQDVAKPQPEIKTQPEIKPQPVTEDLPPPVLPNAQVPCCPPPSPPPISTCRGTCPTSKQKAQSFIPVKEQHLEWPLQNRMKWKKTLLSKIKQSREAYGQPSPDALQDIWGSQMTMLSPSPPGTPNKPQGQPEQGSQKRFLRHAPTPDPPLRFQASWEPRPSWGQSLGTFPYQANDEHGPSQLAQPSVLASENNKGKLKKDSDQLQKTGRKGKVTFKLEDPSKDMERDLKRGLEHLKWSLGRTAEKQEMEDTKSSLRRLRKGDSGCHLSRNRKKFEKILQPHLGKKSGQINKGLIPLCVRRSWLTTSHTHPKPSTLPKPLNLESLKGPRSYVNTSKELSFLDMGICKLLESDIRSRARNRWPPPQTLDPMDLNLRKAPNLSFSKPALFSLGSRKLKASSIVKVAHFLEELPQKSPGETVIKKLSVPPLRSPLPASSPAEVQKAWREKAYGGSQGTSGTPPPAQEGPLSSQPHKYSLLERTQQSRVIRGSGRCGLEPRASVAMGIQKLQEESSLMASVDPSGSQARVEIKIGSPSSTAGEARETEVEKAPEWEVTVGASVMANHQTINVNLRSVGSVVNSTGPPPSRISIPKESGDQGLKAQVAGGVELNLQVGSQKQPRDSALGFLEDTGAPHTTASLPSQASLCSCQGGSMPAIPCEHPRPLCEAINSRMAASLGQDKEQEQEAPTENDSPERKEIKILYPRDAVEGYEMLNLEEEERPEEDRAFSPIWLSSPAKVRKIHSRERVSSSCPAEEQAPPGSQVKKRVKDFLQCLQPRKKGRGQEDSLQIPPKLPPTTVQSQVSMASMLSADSGEAEAQALMAAVGQILVDKLKLHFGNSQSELSGHKKEARVPLSRESSCHRGYYDPEQSSLIEDMACGQEDSSRSQSQHVDQEWTQPWVRDRHCDQDLPLRRPVGLATPQRPVGAGMAGHLHHYSTYFFQKGVLYGHPDHVSHEYTDERSLHSQNSHIKRKTVLSHVRASYHHC